VTARRGCERGNSRRQPIYPPFSFKENYLYTGGERCLGHTLPADTTEHGQQGGVGGLGGDPMADSFDRERRETSGVSSIKLLDEVEGIGDTHRPGDIYISEVPFPDTCGGRGWGREDEGGKMNWPRER